MDPLQDSVRYQDLRLLEITQLLVVQATMQTSNTLNHFWNKKCKFSLIIESVYLGSFIFQRKC